MHMHGTFLEVVSVRTNISLPEVPRASRCACITAQQVSDSEQHKHNHAMVLLGATWRTLVPWLLTVEGYGKGEKNQSVHCPGGMRK